MTTILHEMPTPHGFVENGVRPDLDLQTRPLNMVEVAGIVHSPDPLLAIREISTPYPYDDFLAPVDPLKFKSCIDDRPRIGRVVQSPNGNIMIFEKPYIFEPKTDKYLSNRDMLGSRPLAGGRFAVDSMSLIEGMLSEDTQAQPFWQNQGEDFVQGLMEYVMQRSNRVCEGLGLPIHIDNNHGTLPVWVGSEDRGKPHYQNLQKVLNEMEGCGALANFLGIAAGTIKVMGQIELAEKFIAKMEGEVTEKGIVRVPKYASIAANILYRNAIEQDSPVDIMKGPHKPTGVVFSLGNVSFNRRLATLALGQNNTFKVDLGVINMPESTLASVGHRVHEEFGNGFDWKRFTQFTVAHNLVTLLTLNQEGIPRYHIDKYINPADNVYDFGAK